MNKNSNFVAGYLSDGTQQAYAASNNKDDSGKDSNGHPLMPADKGTQHAVHRALKSVHHAVFNNPKHDSPDKLKKAHQLLVDSAKPDDDEDDVKRKAGK